MPQKDLDFVKKLLRRGSTRWPGRSECLKRHRKKVFVRNGKNGAPIYKFHWQCAICKEWTDDLSTIEVDHIEEIGTFVDWNSFIEKLFCGQENLQALCIPCHMKKTQVYNSARTRWERKVPHK